MVVEIIKNLILNGKLPFNRKYIGWLAYYILPVVALLSIIFGEPGAVVEIGESGWQLLLVILFISPVKDIFPQFGVLSIS